MKEKITKSTLYISIKSNLHVKNVTTSDVEKMTIINWKKKKKIPQKIEIYNSQTIKNLQ